MAPSPTCTTQSAATTKKYLIVARCEGVGFSPSSGSVSGSGSVTGKCSFDAKYQTMPPIPASNNTKLMTLQTTESPVGRFPTSSSCGQFCVKLTFLPGRLVEAAHEVHQKNALMAWSFTGSLSAP